MADVTDVVLGVLGAIALTIVIAALLVLPTAWLFMLLLGTLHANVSEAVPPISFGASIAPAFLMSLLYGRASTSSSSS